MKPLGDERLHYMLARRMAKAVGADIAAAQEDGRLSETDWADAVNRCRGCDDPVDCVGWLADHHDGAETTPGYCRNTALFEALKVPAE